MSSEEYGHMPLDPAYDPPVRASAPDAHLREVERTLLGLIAPDKRLAVLRRMLAALNADESAALVAELRSGGGASWVDALLEPAIDAAIHRHGLDSAAA